MIAELIHMRTRRGKPTYLRQIAWVMSMTPEAVQIELLEMTQPGFRLADGTPAKLICLGPRINTETNRLDLAYCVIINRESHAEEVQ